MTTFAVWFKWNFKVKFIDCAIDHDHAAGGEFGANIFWQNNHFCCADLNRFCGEANWRHRFYLDCF